jgi:hypothetical protein
MSSGVLPCCNSYNLEPNEAFTSRGNAERSSLLLAIHTIGRCLSACLIVVVMAILSCQVDPSGVPLSAGPGIAAEAAAIFLLHVHTERLLCP